MDAGRVLVLRELLATSGWVERTTGFARTLRRSTTSRGGLLLVGTPDAEPWHLAAHLTDESQYSGVPELAPTLVRYRAPDGAPPHLSVTLQRLEQAGRGETVFVVADEVAPDELLERAWDARKVGATVLAIDHGDPELEQVAHESLVVPPAAADAGDTQLPEGFVRSPSGLAVPAVSMDTVQHLVSVAVGEPTGAPTAPRLRDRISRALEALTGPRHDA